MKVYVVCWGSGWQDDCGNTQTNSGVHGVYDSLNKAKVAIDEYKDIFIKELEETIIDSDYSEDEVKEVVEDMDIEIYGSADAGYYEIDYYSCDTRNEMHISIRDVEVQ
jgi:hypothetical protein